MSNRAKRLMRRPSPNGSAGPHRPVPAAPATPLRLDLGCGSNKRQDNGPWVGVDSIAFPGVDVVADLRGRWPWDDSAVAEAHASHFLEHLTGRERVHFVNELYRVLVPGGKCTVVTPHWASNRAYGDFTHEWPPVSEMWFYYLLRAWRLGDPAAGAPANAPHTDAAHNPDGYACDFDATWGYALHPEVALKAQPAQTFCLTFYKEAASDLIATLTARK